MSNLFFKNITIENLRCFEKVEINFNIPDGTTEGSGLNIIIGENANGKTTILEGINFLTQNSYSTENKLSINDFLDKDKEIYVKAETNEFVCEMPYPGNYFECSGIEFKVKNRDRKSPGKLLSSPFQLNSFFINKNKNYKNSKDKDSGKVILPLYKLFSNGIIINDDINVFFFDKNRTRQLTTGTFRTTFDRICDDLNWKFSKKIDKTNLKKIIDNISGEYFKNVIDIAQKGTGSRLAKELEEFFNKKEYENLKIELLELLQPFSTAFFAIRNDGELKQIKTRELGSGIEMILSLLLLKSIAGESKGGIIYLIDEPEIHLHPKAQYKLIELLMKESKTKQIILTTHSPYIFKNCLSKNIGFLTLTKNDKSQINIDYPKVKGWGNFPWSPSWGEINYYAFGLSLIDFHNELYGFIQEDTHNYFTQQMDNYLEDKGISKDKSWIKIKSGKTEPPLNVTLPTYIRNTIHHPENKSNPDYSDLELSSSIDLMIKLLPISKP